MQADDADEMVRATRLLLGQGQARQAEALIRARLRAVPDDGVAVANLGVVLDAQGRHADAAACYRAALERDPRHAEAHHNLALLLLRQGERAAAAAHLAQARALADGNPQVRLEATLAHMVAALDARADQVVLPPDVVGEIPAEMQPAVAAALARLAGGGGAPAMARLRQLLSEAPQAGRLAVLVGSVALWQGLLEEARAVLADAIGALLDGFVPRAAAPPKTLDRAAAAAALFGAIDALEAAGLAPFLNGGTALGCVRDGDFIAHDSDVDLGLLPGADPALVIDAIDAHPALAFAYHDVAEGQVIRVRFAGGGVGGDVFLYQDDAHGFWCGVQRGPHALRWADSPFTPAPATFLGRRVLLPDPVDRYLAENYGDWRTPDPDHVPGFSAPNLLAPGSLLIRCTAMLSLASPLAHGDAAQARRFAAEAAARFPDEPALRRAAERLA